MYKYHYSGKFFILIKFITRRLTYDKKLLISFIFFLIFSSHSTADAAYKYEDVPQSNSHYTSITTLQAHGLIGGYKGDDYKFYFKPNEYIKRSEAAAIFYRILDLEELENPENIIAPYKDLDVSNPLIIPLASIIKNGIIKGENHYFNDTELNREQMATTIVRAFNLKNKSNQSTKMNLANVSSSHKESVNILSQWGITTEVKDFRPKDLVTRTQFITFMFRTMKTIGIEKFTNYSTMGDEYDAEMVVSRVYTTASSFIYGNKLAQVPGLSKEEVKEITVYTIKYPNTPIKYKNVKAFHVPQQDSLGFWVLKDLTNLKKLLTYPYQKVSEIPLPENKTLEEIKNHYAEKNAWFSAQHNYTKLGASHMLTKRNNELEQMAKALKIDVQQAIDIINHCFLTGEVYVGEGFISYFDFTLGSQWYVTSWK